MVTYVGNWIDLHHYESTSIWFNLGWSLPYVAGGLVALTWRPPAPASSSTPAPTGFVDFLGTNLVLVALLLCIDLLMGRWKAAHGETLTTIAVAASLLAFTVRLALTQYHQQREIAQRKAAQDELFAANETITGLLGEARIETSAITQISELGGLLQACSSRDEAFRIIPERLARLFPGTSGTISVLSPSKDRAESAAKWGMRSSLNQTFVPDECGPFDVGVHTIFRQAILLCGVPISRLRVPRSVSRSLPMERLSESSRFKTMHSAPRFHLRQTPKASVVASS